MAKADRHIDIVGPFGGVEGPLRRRLIGVATTRGPDAPGGAAGCSDLESAGCEAVDLESLGEGESWCRSA